MLATRNATTPPGEGLWPKGPSQRPLLRVVEDDISIQHLFEGIGAATGADVVAYRTVAEFLATFDEARPGCLVLDLNLPDGTGLTILQELSQRQCTMPVVFMSGRANVSEVVRALKLGSLDFVEKPFELQTMVEALQRAVAMDLERRQTRAAGAELARRFARLTPREREVMDLIVQGAANKEVAAKLGLSPKTVEVHRANVMRKTQAGSLAELVRLTLAVAK